MTSPRRLLLLPSGFDPGALGGAESGGPSCLGETTEHALLSMNFTVEGLVQFRSKWEIQVVVLFSFTLQIFLFFGGSIRRYNMNTLLRLSIWLAYVGADMVAVYALGLISQNDQNATTLVGCQGVKNPNSINSNHSHLAFFWAPFLLIHLGGQDTMTAFSVEDNNLWLRHLLNLSIQVFLALYAFWKWTDRHNNLKILAPAILVFVAGIIRYGERTWALKCSSRYGLRETNWQLQKLNVEADKGSYVSTVLYALSTMPGIRDLFSGRTVSQMKVREVFKFQADRPLDQVLKLLEVELAMMYDDLYTKAMVLRTRSGVILRCISKVSMISAFVLFVIVNRRQYSSRTDVAITYVLFIGGFGIEACAIILMVMSPWTWAFFKARKCEMFAHVTWLLLSSSIGWPEKRILWSNSMGQYNFLSSCIVHHESRTSSKVLIYIRKVLSSVEKKIFVRKLRHTKYVQVNKDIMEDVVTWVQRVAREEFTRKTEQQQWLHLRPIIKATLNSAANSFGDNIILLHTYTELHQMKQPNDEAIGMNGSINTIMDVCKKISNYMVYLLVVQPSMLPLSGTAKDTLAEFYEKITKNNNSSKQDVLDTAYQLVENILEFGDEECLKEQEEPGPWCETLVEIRDTWMRLLIFAAGKCPVDLHAKQLGRGGDLLTFVWLFMAHCGIGDVAHQVDLISSNDVMSGQFCAFHFPSEAEQSSA